MEYSQLLEKAMAPHSSTLAWKIPWMEELGRLQSMGLLRVRHAWATSLSPIGEGNSNRLQYSCLENPRDWGVWPRPAPAATLWPLVSYSSVCSQNTVSPGYRARPTVFVTSVPRTQRLSAYPQAWTGPGPELLSDGGKGKACQDRLPASICSLGLRNRRAGPSFSAVFPNSSPLRATGQHGDEAVLGWLKATKLGAGGSGNSVDGALGVSGPHKMTLSSGGPRIPEVASLGRRPGQRCFLEYLIPRTPPS